MTNLVDKLILIDFIIIRKLLDIENFNRRMAKMQAKRSKVHYVKIWGFAAAEYNMADLRHFQIW